MKFSIILVAAIASVPAATFAQDWTGSYAGAAVGFADIDVNDGALSGEGESAGLFAGYNYDAGGIVYGAEFDFDSTEYEITGTDITIDTTTRLKGRVGVPVGNGLAYGVGGIISATSDQLPDGQGYLYGVGYDLRVGQNGIVGAELLGHQFEDDDREVEVNTFRVRAGFNF